MSIRGDILAHAQAEWEMRLASGYSPTSIKNENDGIDFLLHFAFLWPSLLTTTDKKVRDLLRNLKSFQAGWTFYPSELAKHWKQGRVFEPKWP